MSEHSVVSAHHNSIISRRAGEKNLPKFLLRISLFFVRLFPPDSTGTAAVIRSCLISVRSKLWATYRCRRIYCVDLVLSGVAILLATLIRFGLEPASSELRGYDRLWLTIPALAMVCAVVFPLTGLYQRSWKYASIADLLQIARAVVLASVVFVALMFISTRLDLIPRSVIAIEVLTLVPLMAMARLRSRLGELRNIAPASRPMSQMPDLVPILLVGAGDSAELFLRALARDPNPSYWPVGILDDSEDQHGLMLRGVPILGGYDEFDSILQALEDRGRRPRHLVFTETAGGFNDFAIEALIDRAEKLGLAISRLRPATQLASPRSESKFDVRPIELTDLLERPQKVLDTQTVARFVRGRRVLVTGAGGSIGSELTKQVAALAPAEIIVLDSGEYNLYSIDLELNEKFPHIRHTSYLCNIREAARVQEIFATHQPEIVFHAAALKHVPMVELNPCEGILTNVIGTVNVANAVRRYGALAMVQVSTDKVVNSTSVMGASKRIAELYCQALDLESLQGSGGPRVMTVRFGNVLGSSGSLIPLFKRQIEQGGPLTVTHPEVTRFFMTIREAVELTLQASAHALERRLGRGEIFVLDMGKPVKIMEIASRMIRLAGYVPGRDIPIKIVGLRPGEKLFEELFDSSETKVQSSIAGVLGAVSAPLPLRQLEESLGRLKARAEKGDRAGMFKVMQEFIPNYGRETNEPTRDAADACTPEQAAVALL
jgi:FlaA1/EpsC-like NDP-sugar epimerase